jgi:hypothetical protein
LRSLCKERNEVLHTFACYGAHLHGDESGSVDRRHNLFGGRSLEADPQRAGAERRSMNSPPKPANRSLTRAAQLVRPTFAVEVGLEVAPGTDPAYAPLLCRAPHSRPPTRFWKKQLAIEMEPIGNDYRRIAAIQDYVF